MINVDLVRSDGNVKIINIYEDGILRIGNYCVEGKTAADLPAIAAEFCANLKNIPQDIGASQKVFIESAMKLIGKLAGAGKCKEPAKDLSEEDILKSYQKSLNELLANKDIIK